MTVYNQDNEVDIYREGAINKWSDWLTADETKTLLGFATKSSLFGQKRYIEQYKVRMTLIGGTRLFYVDDVRRLAGELSIRKYYKQKKDKSFQELRKEATEKFDIGVQKYVSGRNYPVENWIVEEDAMAMCGYTTRQGLYRLADVGYMAYNNKRKKIRTLKIGRTTLYNRRDFLDFKANESIKEKVRKRKELSRNLLTKTQRERNKRAYARRKSASRAPRDKEVDPAANFQAAVRALVGEQGQPDQEPA